MRYALALDLIDDDEKIAAYEQAHRAIWPEVRQHLLDQGVLELEIFRLGTRLFMVMEVNPEVYSAERMAVSSLRHPVIVKWETLMWAYQAPTPWTPDGEKWVVMRKIFDLTESAQEN